jgi:hypothetical protein
MSKPDVADARELRRLLGEAQQLLDKINADQRQVAQVKRELSSDPKVASLLNAHHRGLTQLKRDLTKFLENYRGLPDVMEMFAKTDKPTTGDLGGGCNH